MSASARNARLATLHRASSALRSISRRGPGPRASFPPSAIKNDMLIPWSATARAMLAPSVVPLNEETSGCRRREIRRRSRASTRWSASCAKSGARRSPTGRAAPRDAAPRARGGSAPRRRPGIGSPHARGARKGAPTRAPTPPPRSQPRLASAAHPLKSRRLLADFLHPGARRVSFAGRARTARGSQRSRPPRADVRNPRVLPAELGGQGCQ